jgi:hypothetical protein
MTLPIPLLLPALLFSAPAAARVQPSPDSAAVRAVVERYLHGLKFNDVAALKEAFWPEAKLYWTERSGAMGQIGQDAWYATFAASAGKEEQGDLRIASLDVTADIASVKVVETYAKSIYIDYLNLLKFDGRWRIVNKVYTSRRR